MAAEPRRMMLAQHPSDHRVTAEAQRTYAAIPVRWDDVVLDLGAHVGAASVDFLDRGAAKVIAVEPDPDNLVMLRDNLRGRPAVVIAAAVGNGLAATLYRLADHSYLSTIVGPDRGRTSHLVPLVSLRDLLDEHRPTIVKCDIEFGEYDLPELHDLPRSVRVLALELHVRYDLIFLHRRETPDELRARRRAAADLIAAIEAQGFRLRQRIAKFGPDEPVHDDTGLEPLLRSIDAVWIR